MARSMSIPIMTGMFQSDTTKPYVSALSLVNASDRFPASSVIVETKLFQDVLDDPPHGGHVIDNESSFGSARHGSSLRFHE